MDARQALAAELEDIPEPLLLEVVDFIRFLKTKAVEEKLETAWLSQPALEKDWLRPEEDQAWRDL